MPGKTQRTALTSILENFDHAIGATEAALDSEGSAAEENAKRMDSLNGKLTQLQSAWQSFARDTINSDFIKKLLDGATALVKFTDSIGGLPTLLIAATSALMLFKGGLILDKVFKAFSGGLSSIQNGLITLVTALPNAISAFKSFSAGVISAGLAIEAAVPLLSVIALAITGVVAGINAYTKAQKEATTASIENSQTAGETIESKEKEKEKIEDEIKTLEKEKQAYIDNMEAKNEGTDNSEFVEAKNAEIKKRQENIDKIDEENKKLLVQREAAARSIKTNKADSTGLGWNQWYGASTQEEANTLRENIKNINKELKDTGGNTGAYKRKLEELRGEYEKQAQAREENGEKAEAENETIKAINKELAANSEKYEEDKKAADEFYDILKSGGNISDENINWLKNFYNLTDDQISKLKEGNDVLNNSENAVDDYTEAISKLEQQATSYESIVTGNVQQVKDYQTNVDLLKQANQELASSTGLTADTFLQLQSAGLLKYLTEVGGEVQADTQEFKNNAQALIASAEAALKNEWAQEQMQLILAASNNTLDDQASKLGLVNTESSKFDKSKTITQLQQEAMTLVAGSESWKAYYKSMGGEDVDLNVENIKAQQDKLQDYLNQSTKNFEARIKAVNSIKLDTTKTETSGESTKSTQEEYKAEIDLLYEYENALDNAKEEVDRLKDALSDTDDYEEQERYINQLIEALNNQIAKTKDLKDAQSSQIQDYINQLRDQGFYIDYNAEKNELLINNMQHLADFSGDTAKALEKIIKKIQDLNSNNRTLDGSIRDLTGDVKDYYDQLADIPEKKLEKFNDLMKEFQQSQLDAVQDQIDDLNNAMKNDERLKALEAEIEALEKQNDTIDKQKEMEEKLLAVEEARQKLQNAMTQKTLQVYREGQGFVWETDPDAIKDAQDELKDAEDALNEQIRDDKLDKLKEEQENIKNSYQDQIDALEDFLENQNYIIDKANREGIQSFEDLRKKLEEFGLDSEENLKKASDWLNQYNDALSKVNQTATTALNSSKLATNGLIYSSATQSRIDQAMSGMNVDTTMTGVPIAQYDKLDKDTGGQNIYIDTIELPNVSNANEFVEALKDLPRLATAKSSSRK